MPKDYGSIFNLDAMTDEDVQELIREQFEEYPEIDPDLVDVAVDGGHVTLSGRVGTEQEYQQVEHIVTDVLGIRDYSNDMVVDELTRGERSEAADEAVAQDNAVDSQLGEGGEKTEPSADHLVENLETELYGTHDLQDAIEQGESYTPPDRPIQEGNLSHENH